MSTSPPPGAPPPGGPPPGAPDITLLFGPLLIGVLLNAILFGVMVVQAFIYYHRYRSDRPWFRYLVLYLVIIETANLVCDVGLIYEPLIVRYATLGALITSPIMLRVDAVLTVLISTPIQLFIAWRLFVVTNSKILPVIISILAIISFGGGIAVTTLVTIHPAFASFPSFHPAVLTWLVSTTACDVLLTASLAYSLWTRKTNIASTDTYINKIIRRAFLPFPLPLPLSLSPPFLLYAPPQLQLTRARPTVTVQTGLITATAAILDMLLTILSTDTSLNFIFDFPLSKLYTNALISTLNARPWREDSLRHDAPNALFEPSAGAGRPSFNLQSRGAGQSALQSASYGANGGDSRNFQSPSKYNYDIAP
ncbi:hypothetical protein C8R46DRAFT_1209139 [Mycena filopes]|nr:hypothetical protein C8R46DRAFT_1209139 [Mycena filopes]